MRFRAVKRLEDQIGDEVRVKAGDKLKVVDSAHDELETGSKEEKVKRQRLEDQSCSEA